MSASAVSESAAGPVRVFHLIKGLGRGGAEMLLADAPARSDKGRFRYGFGYFLPWKNALAEDIERRIGEVVCFDAASSWQILASAERVARRLREFRADIVHCHMPLASVVGRIAGAHAGIPVVSTEHNVLERYHPATRLATLSTWGMQRHVIAVSGEVARSIAAHAPATVPVTVVRNGVSLDRFVRRPEDRGAARAALGIAPDAAVVGTIAVFRTQKRLDLWLTAASAILRRFPSSRFLLVGDGPMRAQVENAVDTLGLRDQVVLPGLHEDVRPFLRAMDVYMMSSDFEGLPVALLEAMALELVPVTTSVGGIPEVVSDGCGRVVPRGAPEALAAAVIEVLSASGEQRVAWGRHARRVVSERFSTERMIRETEAVYRRVLAGG